MNTNPAPVKIRGKKVKTTGEFEVTYVLDQAGVEQRLLFVNGQIGSLENSIKNLNGQLELFKQEKTHIEAMLGDTAENIEETNRKARMQAAIEAVKSTQ